MIFEYDESANPKQLLECKNVIISNGMLVEKRAEIKDPIIEAFESQPKEVRLLTYKLMIDKFNQKYSGLDESQKRLLNKYITNVNDTAALKEYIEKVIPEIKKELSTQAKSITDKATKIKVQKLSEMLCTVENMKSIKESHILSLLRYFDLIKELKGLH
jgi:ribosomal protein L23